MIRGRKVWLRSLSSQKHTGKVCHAGIIGLIVVCYLSVNHVSHIVENNFEVNAILFGEITFRSSTNERRWSDLIICVFTIMR